PAEFPDGAVLTFTLRHDSKFAEANVGRFRLYATTAESFSPPPQLPDEVTTILLTAAEKRDDKQKTKLKEQFQSLAPQLAEARGPYLKAKDAEKKFYDAIPITSVMEELEKGRETHILVRGNFLSKGEKVSPATPAVLHPFSPEYPTNRIGLARWLVDPNNPLTGRVIMNRFWEQYFGKGIVETV